MRLLGKEVEHALVTVSAYFSIINEPIATAIAHGLGKNIEETFWLVILVVARRFEAAATNGGTHFGARNLVSVKCSTSSTRSRRNMARRCRRAPEQCRQVYVEILKRG